MKLIVATRRVLLRGLLCLFAIICAGQTAAQAWIPLSPTSASSPSAREAHSAVYNINNNRMIVFGGFNGSNLADVWVLSSADGTGGTPAWTNLLPTPDPIHGSPMARWLHGAVYDAANNRMIVFGGFNNCCTLFLNDVWVLSNADGTEVTPPAWTELLPTGAMGSPTPRQVPHGVTYDSTHNRLIVFGGYAPPCSSSCQLLSDVWVLSNANGLGGPPVWMPLSPATSPPGRVHSSATYDPATNTMTVFGGYSAGSFLDDSWVLSNANGLGGSPSWVQLTPSPTQPMPAGRYLHNALYDPATNHMTIFAGGNASGGLNDVWYLSGANGSGTLAWKQELPTGTAPDPRSGQSAVYNPSNDRMVIYGGIPCISGKCGGYAGDVWVLADANGVNIPVSIAIRPLRAGNSISLSSTGTVPVTILSSASFDATKQVDRTSLTFGHSGSEKSLVGCQNRYTDVNGDGYSDLTCTFKASLSGFQIGDTTGYLQGLTTVGNAINGSDTVNINN